MYRIIDSRGNGKTSRLLLIAKENDAIYVCHCPDTMRNKAYSYGITGITFISYKDFIQYPEMTAGKNVVVDDLEYFVKCSSQCNLIGFTVSKD